MQCHVKYYCIIITRLFIVIIIVFVNISSIPGLLILHFLIYTLSMTLHLLIYTLDRSFTPVSDSKHHRFTPLG